MFSKGLTVFGLMAVSATVSGAAYDWNPVHIWGGGYVPGVTFSAKGDAYLRTDVGGAYKLNADGSWTPLNDSFTDGQDMGSIAFAVDSENEKNVYTTGGLYTDVAWASGGSLFRSTDGGVNWEKIPLTSNNVSGTDESVLTSNGDLCLGGNGEGRGMGNRLAVKGKLIYLGTNQNGLLKSTDQGKTWTTVASFSNKDGVGAVFFDKSGNVYAAPYAGGLYKSTDGNTFTKVDGITGTIYQASLSGNTAWLSVNTSFVLDQNNPSGGSVYKYDVSTGKATKVTMPEYCSGKSTGYLGISSVSDGQIAAVSTGGCWNGKGTLPDADFSPHEAIFYTKDGGSTWTEIVKKGAFDKESAPGAANNNPHWISAVGINPTDPDHLIFGTGYGIWSTHNASATSPTWTFNDKGIEETVPMSLVSTTAGAPLVSAVGDIDGFYHASIDQPQKMRHQKQVGTNYVVDYAGLAPQKMIRIFSNIENKMGAYSEDGGKSWTMFATAPNTVKNEYNSGLSKETNFAAISADGSTIVWNMDTYGIYTSTDKGATWTAVSGTADLAGFPVKADKVAKGTFYIYNCGTGIFYRSTDYGKTWDAVNSDMAKLDNYAYSSGRAFISPDAEGDIWVTQGINIGGVTWTGTTSPGVFHSTDGGKTFTKVDGMDFAFSIGFGKGKTAGKSAIYVTGFESESSPTRALYRSDDQGASWTAIDDKYHKFGTVDIVIGDPCIYSRVYLGTSGRGIVYGQDGEQENACADRIDNGKTSGIRDGRVATNARTFLTLRLDGNRLISSQDIRLFGITGKLVKWTEVGVGDITLDLSGLPNGTYIAKSGHQTLKVNIK